MSQINLVAISASLINTPSPSGVIATFLDSTDNNLKWKDWNGVLHVIAASNSTSLSAAAVQFDYGYFGGV